MDDKETLDTVKRALAIVKDANAPDDLRVPMFNKVWEAITGTGGVVSPQASQVVQAPASTTASDLANKLGVDLDLLQDVFEEDENGFKVVVSVTKLPSKKWDATIDLTLLICAGRQIKSAAATTGAEVREQGQQFAKFDDHNFTTILKKRDDLWIAGGSGQNRTIKLRNDGWKKGGELLRAYAGGKNGG